MEKKKRSPKPRKLKPKMKPVLKLADLQAQQRVQEGKAAPWVRWQGAVSDSRSGMRNLRVTG